MGTKVNATSDGGAYGGEGNSDSAVLVAAQAPAPEVWTKREGGAGREAPFPSSPGGACLGREKRTTRCAWLTPPLELQHACSPPVVSDLQH